RSGLAQLPGLQRRGRRRLSRRSTKRTMSVFSNRAQLLFSRRAQVLGLFADILDYPAPGLAGKASECAALIGAAQTEAGALPGKLPPLRRGDLARQASGDLQRLF